MSHLRIGQFPESFSKREIEILSLMKEGLSNQAIAQKLFLSLETIKWYNRQIFGKLSAGSRVQAIGKAVEIGLISPLAHLPAYGADRLPSAVRPKHNLPAELTSLVGREADLAEVARLLTLSTTRLITLTGSGGCGKTRLAFRTGRNLAGNFPHGSWRVELAPLSDHVLLLETVVSALGLVVSPDREPMDILTAFLKERELLLILDNCEHLIDEVARLVVHLLSDCPCLKILATSREPLSVPGEITYRVPSLALPPGDESASIESYPAVQLFLERARSIQPDYRLVEDEGPALAYICRRLDGIPLAIELAAARVSVLSAKQIAARLEGGFRVLGAGNRAAIPRHATLGATVAWSYNLLMDPERVLLRRLPLFSGGWTIEQAEEICAEDELEQEQALDRLAALVSKSLVAADRLPNGTMRYHLHEMVRQYARERLAEAGEEEALRRRYIDYFIRLVEEAEPELKKPGLIAWLARLDQEHANLLEALNLAALHKDAIALVRLSSALVRYWLLRSQGLEGWHWLKTALEMQEALPCTHEDTLRSRLLIGLIDLGFNSGLTVDLNIIRECEHIYQKLSDEKGLSYVRVFKNWRENPIAWAAQLRDSLPKLLAANELWTAAYIMEKLFGWERAQGNFAAGQACIEEAAAYARTAGDPFLYAWIIQKMSWLEWDKGEVREASNLADEALHIFSAIGIPYAKAKGRQLQAYFSAALGDFNRAFETITQAIEILQLIGDYSRQPAYRQNLGLYYLLNCQFLEAKSELDQAMKLVSEPEKIEFSGLYYLRPLGLILFYEGQVEHAAEVLLEDLKIMDQYKDSVTLHEPLRALGQVRLAQGDLPTAHQLLHRTLAEITRNRTLPDFPETLDVLGQLALAEGHPEQAARLLGASDGLLKRMEMVRYPVFRPEYERCRTAACATMGEMTFAAIYAEGEETAASSSPIEAINSIMEYEVNN